MVERRRAELSTVNRQVVAAASTNEITVAAIARYFPIFTFILDICHNVYTYICIHIRYTGNMNEEN